MAENGNLLMYRFICYRHRDSLPAYGGEGVKIPHQ